MMYDPKTTNQNITDRNMSTYRYEFINNAIGGNLESNLENMINILLLVSVLFSLAIYNAINCLIEKARYRSNLPESRKKANQKRTYLIKAYGTDRVFFRTIQFEPLASFKSFRQSQQKLWRKCNLAASC